MITSEKMFLFVESDASKDTGMNFFIVPDRYEYYPNDEQVKLSEIEIKYKIPEGISEQDIREKAIKTLRDKQERVVAEAEIQRQKLQVKIDGLLMLTNQEK